MSSLSSRGSCGLDYRRGKRGNPVSRLPSCRHRGYEPVDPPPQACAGRPRRGALAPATRQSVSNVGRRQLSVGWTSAAAHGCVDFIVQSTQRVGGDRTLPHGRAGLRASTSAAACGVAGVAGGTAQFTASSCDQDTEEPPAQPARPTLLPACARSHQAASKTLTTRSPIRGYPCPEVEPHDPAELAGRIRAKKLRMPPSARLKFRER